MHKIWALMTLLVFTSLHVNSQDAAADFLDIEFELGLGYAQSSDNNLFNDRQGVDPGGGVGINMGFRYHFDYNWSAGLHILILTDGVRQYDPDLVLGYYTEDNLSLSNLNIGVNGKYTHNLIRWQPYAFGGLGVSLGSLTTLNYEEPVNDFIGIAMDMGIGLGYMITNQVMLSTSLLRNYGVAWWSDDPSFESINKEFNPGFWLVAINFSIFLANDLF